MSSKYKFETRDERIERMARDNPGQRIELCTAVVDNMWESKRQLIRDEIPERFLEAGIADLGYSIAKIVEAVSKILDSTVKDDNIGLIFCGPAGSGKTYAAYAVIQMISERNPEMIAFMADYSRASSDLKNEFYKGTYEQMGSTWDRMTNESGIYNGLMFLDDVPGSKPTDFELDKLLMVLERRFNYYMPFMLTTNISPENFKEVFGERIASRLLGYCKIITFGDEDQRIKKNDENQKL
jgi:DNA replication protein DnaC